METEQDRHIVYSLGGGCWVYSDMPKQYRVDSIFKASWSSNQKFFLPLELFNGNLENEFLHKDLNWKFKNLNETNWDFNHPNWTGDSSNYLAFYDLININNGFRIAHCHQRKDNPANKNTWKPLFKEFNERKYNLLYLIDFQRSGYNLYTNQQLLEFEKYLVEHNFNLNNFIYIDVDNAKDKNRFDNCKIPLFIQNHEDEKGWKANHADWRNPQCFFANHMGYVEQQIDRILKEKSEGK